ncbi:MAG: CHASE3 domain-containing protein [Acidobacteria bacterium]|nr:CHASE3 domain-containing protein [Acidobacteriota bacterium]
MLKKIGRGAATGLLLALGAFLLNAAITATGVVRLRAEQEEIARVRTFLIELGNVFSTLKDAETGQRGYLLTGEDAYLGPYRAAASLAREQIARLRASTADAAQLKRIDAFESRAESKLTELAISIDVRQVAGADAARTVVLSGRGKDDMDALREMVADMESVARKALSERNEAMRASFASALFTTVLSAAVGLLMVGVAYVLFVKDVAAREKAARELEVWSETLEVRVAERTHALSEANERLTREVEERSRAEKAVRSLADELARSNRELEQFATVASHDLQEPLRKIQAFGERLQQGSGAALSEQGKDYLRRMLNAAARMRGLIEDLLTFSRVTSKAQPFRQVDLGVVAREVLSDLEEQVTRTKARITLEPLPSVEADASQMRQLFQNLLGNALKFTKPGETPSIVVSSRIEDGRAIVSVRDEGIGFDEVYKDRIFEVFQRLHGRSEYEGTGMGLAICKKIVERHGGCIDTRSAPGLGATFLVSLPLTRGKRPEETDAT